MKFSGFIFAAEDENSHQDRYEFLFNVAAYLDKNDFTALWTPERHFQEFGGSFPNPAVLSAALAARTSQLQLRAGSVVAPHHHSVRIAEEWALVDQISKGRAGVCFAAGWHMRDFVFYPENYQERKAVMFDKIAEVQSLWSGKTGRFRTNGEVVDVKTFPPPYQKNIPLWLVFSNDPEVWIKAGENGFNILSLLNSWETIEQNIGRYRNARAQHGHDPKTGIVTIALHTFIGESTSDVRSLVEQPLKAYLASFLLAKNDDKKLSSRHEPMTPGEKSIILEGAFRDLFENRSLLGDLHKCANVVARLQSIGVNEVAALIDFGMDFNLVLSAMDKLTQLKQQFTREHQEQPVCDATKSPFDWYFNRNVI